ncbi:MAG: aryl-sulfate sulfotransferase, partial [Promethearchaeota archaeon]
KLNVVHSNTVFFDGEEDIIYYNSRNTNTFYKINHSSGAVIWGLGEYGNFTLYDKYGRERASLFYHAHALKKVDDNTFILFDNDHHNKTDPNSNDSRILEITIDEATMTANESWSWTAPEDYYSTELGDADRLPNGNRLGAFGTRTHPNTDIGARLVEVNEGGEIIWEMNFPQDEFSYYIYRADRVRFQPILSSPPDIQSIVTENVTVSWNIWYNFRSKRYMNGSYALYLDGEKVESGLHTFEKFWRHTTLNYTLNYPELGREYNLTLAVADKAGHITTDSVSISIRDFYLIRSGPEFIEAGEDVQLRWAGETITPLSYKLRVDDYLVDSGNWTGEDIIFDPTSLKLGSHSIMLMLINNLLLVHIDSFLLTKYPAAPPQFLANPRNQTLIWNETLTLSWKLFDHKPKAWAIYLDGEIQLSSSWINQNITVNWTVPPLNEGFHNITFAAYDQVELLSSSTTWLIITSPSPAVISATPADREIQWGEKGAVLCWEVHGGKVWQLVKNNSQVGVGFVRGQSIEVPIIDWWNQWLPGTYELILKVLDIHSVITTATSLLTIRAGDAYANYVVTGSSAYYTNGENALGAPDGENATIYQDYSNGYLTLDFDENEEIIDGEGADFIVFAAGGTYRVWGGTDLSKQFRVIGIGQGNQFFYLSKESFTEVRYVRIEYFSGANILLDAVEALNYNVPEIEPQSTTPTTSENAGEIAIATQPLLFIAGITLLTTITIKRKIYGKQDKKKV